MVSLTKGPGTGRTAGRNPAAPTLLLDRELPPTGHKDSWSLMRMQSKGMRIIRLSWTFKLPEFSVGCYFNTPFSSSIKAGLGTGPGVPWGLGRCPEDSSRDTCASSWDSRACPQGVFLTQKLYFKPNWMILGSSALEIRPNRLLLMLVF